MKDCLFCKIIDKEIPSNTIYEDDYIKVFLDINPVNPGHMLIIPKNHFKDMDDISEEYLSKVFVIAKKMKKLVEDKLNPSGISFTQNNGSVQEVKHFHLHLIPYYQNKFNISQDEIYKILKTDK